MRKIFLITGFLGAGKSTFLINVLTNTDKRTGVLMNEFGKISVDTNAINRTDIDLIELINGSIFCSCLKDKFIDGLVQLIKSSVEEIFIESSGLADPSDVENIMEVVKKQAPEEDVEFSGVICLVDAMFFLKQIDVLESVRRQIKHSHLIIINKIDLVDKEQIDKIKKTIIGINSDAEIECVSYGKISKQINEISKFYISPQMSTNSIYTRPYNIMIEFDAAPSIGQIEKFFQECGGYLYRAKGYIIFNQQIYKVDVVYEIIKVEKTHDTVKPDELNKIVLLAKEDLSSIKHISLLVNLLFKDNVKITC